MRCFICSDYVQLVRNKMIAFADKQRDVYGDACDKLVSIMDEITGEISARKSAAVPLRRGVCVRIMIGFIMTEHHILQYADRWHTYQAVNTRYLRAKIDDRR